MYRPDDDPDSVASLRLLVSSTSTKSNAPKHEMGARCGQARSSDLYSDVCIQEAGGSRRCIVYKQGFRMVNKKDGDEVEVVQLCKGGCHDIPGMVPSLRLRQETPWLGSGRDRWVWSVHPGFFRVVVMLNQCYKMLCPDD